MWPKKYDGLKQLIEAWESFENQHPTGDLQAFARHVLQQDTLQTPSDAELFSVPTLAEVDPAIALHQKTQFQYAKENTIAYEPPLEGVVGYLLGKLMRIIRQDARELLQKTGIGSYDEFSLLATIHTLGNTTRAEVCAENTMEPTTGGEIIKRFIKAGWAEEAQSPADRRAKHIRLTPLGVQTAFACYHEMWRMSSHLLTPLSTPQRQQLLGMLQKMVLHHREGSNKV